MDDSLHEEAVAAVEALVRRLASRFAHAAVEGPTADPPAGMLIGLSCALPGTAKIDVYPSGHDINVYAGSDTWVEIYISRTKPLEARLADLQAVLEAMVGGRYEETTWWRGDKYVKYRAVLRRPDGKPFWKTSAGGPPGLGIFTPGKKATTIKYAAYA